MADIQGKLLTKHSKAMLCDNISGAKSPHSFACRIEGGKIIFEFVVQTAKLCCPYEGHNKPIYEGDVCEIFIGGCPQYYELEVAPNGATFFARITNHGQKADGSPDITAKLLERGFDYSVQRISDGYSVMIMLADNAVEIADVRFNAFVIDRFKAQPLFALSPTFCSTFHCPSAFVKLID